MWVFPTNWGSCPYVDTYIFRPPTEGTTVLGNPHVCFPPLYRDFNRGPNIKALEGRGFINQGS